MAKSNYIVEYGLLHVFLVDPAADVLSQRDVEESKETGTWLAVVALWSLDLAMNASLVAIRAVVADCAPPQQQVQSNLAQVC